MSDLEQLQNARRKMVRYRILKILDAGRPLPVGENLIADILIDADLDATQNDVRKALQYLQDKNYLAIEMPKRGVSTHWSARLLPTGVDYIENIHIDDAGIARPRG